MSRRFLQISLVLGVVFGVLLFFLWRVNSLLIYKPHALSREDPAGHPGWSEFFATNPHGDRIAAWFSPTRPGSPVMVLCHGHAADHAQVEPLGAFFRERGFSLLTLDFRAHGKSGGDFTGIGMREWEDIDVVLKEAERLNYLASDTVLAAFGCSMGAVTLANGIRHLPRIKAFILEACFAELRTVAGHDMENLTGLPDNFLMDIVFWIGYLRSGYQYYDDKPILALRQVATTPVFLIHDGADNRVTLPDFERLRQAVPHAKTLVIPGAPHVQGWSTDRAAFENGILEFLASSGIPLGGPVQKTP